MFFQGLQPDVQSGFAQPRGEFRRGAGGDETRVGRNSVLAYCAE
jgi:hypothetical protein